jgi:hypothetical protein
MHFHFPIYLEILLLYVLLMSTKNLLCIRSVLKFVGICVLSQHVVSLDECSIGLKTLSADSAGMFYLCQLDEGY